MRVFRDDRVAVGIERVVDALAMVAEEAGITLIEMALAFVIRHPAVTAAIIGPRTMEHLESQITAADIELSEDVLDRSGGGESRGRETFKARARGVRSAFADLRVTVDDVVVEGDAIAWRWTLTGTHAGPLLDIAATGKRVTLRGVNFQRVRDGRVAEHWTLADLAGVARQLR